MDHGILNRRADPDHPQFKKLAAELKQLIPYRDESGVLQFRELKRGERPLNRWARRQIARRLVSGELN